MYPGPDPGGKALTPDQLCYCTAVISVNAAVSAVTLGLSVGNHFGPSG